MTKPIKSTDDLILRDKRHKARNKKMFNKNSSTLPYELDEGENRKLGEFENVS